MEESRLRILFLTLEYSDPFSGNGVYSRSIVQNLVSHAGCKVMVLCGKPGGAPGLQKRQQVKSKNDSFSDFVEVRTVTVPIWFKLDRSSSWQEYGQGAVQYEPDVSQFQPDVILGVDWTSRLALECLQRADVTRRIAKTPFVFLCFRVFSQTAGSSQDDLLFYRQRESETLRLAARTVALSRADARALEALLDTAGLNEIADYRPPSVHVLAPPLRDDVRALAVKLLPSSRLETLQRLDWEKWSSMMNVDQRARVPKPPLPPPAHRMAPVDSPARIYVTCCCRISPEKEVMRFVEMCERIAPFLKSHNLIPYLVGPATDALFARRVYQRLKRAFPGDESIIVSDFVAPDKLQSIFTRTILNVHPAVMEPYGMTIAEAAAFGAPSLMDYSGGVGAADVFPSSELYSWGAPLTNVKMAAAAARCALGSPLLDVIGKRAQHRALSWGNKEHSSALRSLLEDVLKNAFRAFDKSLSPSLSAPSSSSPPKARLQSLNAAGLGVGGSGLEPAPNGQAHQDDGDGDDDDWPWLDLIQWAVSDLDVGVVVTCDVRGSKRIVDDLIGLPPYGLASLLLQMRKNHVPMTEVMYLWAATLLARQGGCLGAARFRLVPSRMSEETFWGVFFFAVRRGVIALVGETSQPSSVPLLALIPTTSTNAPSPGSKLEPTPLSLAIAAIERLVQRDECARGIGPLIAALDAGELERSATAILQNAGGRTLVLTGFPCLPVGRTTSQETDGPPGAVAIGRALVACGKRVVFCIEEPNAKVLKNCLAEVFPRARVMMLQASKTVTQVEVFGSSGQVVVETFPVAWTPECETRCDDLLSELAGDGGHMIAIERAGPGSDGQCRTMKGRVMTSEVLAPLHVLFQRASAHEISTIGIGDGGNEVGMGKVLGTVKSSIPNGATIACTTATEHLICCSVSNWGGYALAAALALIGLERSKFKSPREACDLCLGPPSEVERVIAAACVAGARDGLNGHEMSVDGLP